MMFSNANPLLKLVVAAAFGLFGASADASAVTVKAGETYIGIFDLTGFSPVYDPSADTSFSYGATLLTGGPNGLDTVFYSEGGASVIASQLFDCCGGGGLGQKVLGSNFYWLIQGLAGEVVFLASITQGQNTRQAIFSLVAPVPIPAALPLLSAGLAALGFQVLRKRRESLTS